MAEDSRGPSREPCETPAIIVFLVLALFLTTTFYSEIF